MTLWGAGDTNVQTVANSKMSKHRSCPGGVVLLRQGSLEAVARHRKAAGKKGEEASPCRIELWARDLLLQSQVGKVTLGESPQSAGL